jgi:hypothetical protein
MKLSVNNYRTQIKNYMKSKIPDNVVYSVEEGFNANILPYATNVGASNQS